MKRIGLCGKNKIPIPSGRRKLSALAALCALAAVSYSVPATRSLLADTLGWAQTDWSGGLDAGVVATSNNDRTTWTKYSAKSGNVTAGEDAVLNQPTGSVMQTTVGDFGADTLDADIRLDAASGALTLKKANGRACAADAECREAYCLYGVCTDNPFIYGVCAGGIGVHSSDAPSTLQWKTADNICDSTHCPSGQILTADPSVDFSAYPAQQYCVSLGARLPTRAELDCLYTNRATLGGFGSGYYWSNEGRVSAYYYHAYVKNFSGGSWSEPAKNSYNYVRCVRNSS